MLKNVSLILFFLGAVLCILSGVYYSDITSDAARSRAAAERQIERITSEKKDWIARFGPNHYLVGQYDARIRAQHELIEETLPIRSQRAKRGLTAGLLIGAFLCLVPVPLLMAASGVFRRSLYQTLPVAFFGGALFGVIRVIHAIFTDPALDGCNTSETIAFSIGFFVPQFIGFSFAAYVLLLPIAALIIWNKEQETRASVQPPSASVHQSPRQDDTPEAPKQSVLDIPIRPSSFVLFSLGAVGIAFIVVVTVVVLIAR